MKNELAKTYEPGLVENQWYAAWQKNQIFDSNSKSDKEPYSILMPPPNVTGILHFGHVLNITLQDLYIRWNRMQGKEVCWFPGTDHAGIATQTRVEKTLKADENLTRYDIGREKFTEKVWEWKEKYGGIILSQLRKLGVSCDWSRTLFTMDESACNAVKEVFVRLFDDGLIYKGKRIINWSPLAQTALSDEEVEFREVKEHLYTMRYYFADNSGNYLQVATVRPETIFGDTAVAVNPHDERYNKLIGTKVRVPLCNREVEIIGDDYADPKFGTGCVKITPAHDPNDFEVGNRHNLEKINTINPDGTLNELTGEYNGVERFKARKLILERLKELELIEKIEDYTHNVGFSQRGGEPVEPYLSDQWFVSMKPLAGPALQVVLDGKVNFYPNHWHKTYEHWMGGIRDWCISRQLWWGHRIPVYYTPDGKFTAARNEAEARTKLNVGEDVKIRQDEDVLDTWFSSWIWPLTTMRWMGDGKTDETDDMKKFMPTDLLVTAPDIIFFWVARMIMSNLYFKNEIPFKNVYFTSTIRDGLGRKLSKSLGNSPDPLNIIDKYGCDAVRFTMLFLSPLGQDVKMDVDVQAQDIASMEIGRNFANKVWNAGRFLMMKSEQVELPDSCHEKRKTRETAFDMSVADQWILSRMHTTINAINNSLVNFKVNDYSKLIYDFIWSDFCDWYIEILKIQLNNSQDSNYNKSLMCFAMELYDNILKMLHPIMPFITEEIWHHLTSELSGDDSISQQPSPVFSQLFVNPEIEEEFEALQSIIEEMRHLRASASIPPSQKVSTVISSKDEKLVAFFNSQCNIIATMAKCSELIIENLSEKPKNCLASVVRETEIFIILEDNVNIEKEIERINKEIERLERNIAGTESKLNNEKFVANAPANIVEHERTKLESMKQSLEKVRNNLASLTNL